MSTQFTSSFFAKSIGLTAPANENHFQGFTTDTREIKPGFLFIALSGEARDGHEFIDKAIAAGATGVLHRKSFHSPKLESISSFAVHDTLLAYRNFAKAWRKKFSYPVLAVAGSAGKTTSKEFLAALLRGKWQKVHQTQASQNGFTGIPATLLAMRDSHEAAVIEVGIDEPGAMEQHLDIVQPNAGVLTSIGPEHLEKLIDIATVAEEEGKIFSHLEEHHGAAAINCDDPLIYKASEKLHTTRKLYYGFKNPGVKPFLLGQVENNQLIISENGTSFSLPLPLEGMHNALNLLGAVAMAKLAGLREKEIISGLKSFVPPAGRSEVYTWRKNIRVYCDTYNANPLSVRAALEMFLKESEKASQNWVCLGDMLELGTHEEALHRDLAKELNNSKISHVMLLGPRMKQLADEMQKRGYQGVLAHFDTIESLSEKLIQELQPQARVLIKGSRGMRMERVWDALQKSGN